MKRVILLSLSVCAFIAAGCKITESDKANHRTGRKEVSVTVTSPCQSIGNGPNSTKSTVTSQPDRVNDINIYIYSQGRLEESIYTDDIAGIIFYLLPDTEYSFYAIANIGKAVPPDTESEVMGYRYRNGNISDLNTGGFPMSGTLKVTIPAVRDTYTVSIDLVRLIAKYSFSVDRSMLSYSNIEITSARIRQSALDIMPFVTGSSAESVADWDYATKKDIQILNEGGTIEFYMLENCQGVLLPDNTEQWEKVPDNIPSKKDICTYLEVGAKYRSAGVEGDNIIYRMYLGQDSTTDFNIERNTINNVTLKVTDDGIYTASWMVDKGDLRDCRTLAFGAGHIEVTKFGGETTLDIIRNPAGIPFRIEANEYAMDNFKLTYRYTTANQIALSSSMSELGERTLTLKLVSWDNELQDECVVKIVDKVGYLCMESWDGKYKMRNAPHGTEMTPEDFMTCTDYKVCYNFMGGENICNYSYTKNDTYINFRLGHVVGREGRRFWDFNNGAFHEGDPIIEMDMYENGYLEIQLYSYTAQGNEVKCNLAPGFTYWSVKINQVPEVEMAKEMIRNAGDMDEPYNRIGKVTATTSKTYGSYKDVMIYKWCIKEYPYDGIPLQLLVYFGFLMDSTDTGNWNSFGSKVFNEYNRETNMIIVDLHDAKEVPFHADHISYAPSKENENTFYHPSRNF